MSYAIGHIVFGIEIVGPTRSILTEMDVDPDFIGCKTFYSGNGDEPIYCGVVLGNISEGSNQRGANLANLLQPPAMKTQKEAKELIAAAKQKCLEVLRKAGSEVSDDETAEAEKLFDTKPEVLLIWGSS